MESSNAEKIQNWLTLRKLALYPSSLTEDRSFRPTFLRGFRGRDWVAACNGTYFAAAQVSEVWVEEELGDELPHSQDARDSNMDTQCHYSFHLGIP